MIKNKPISYGLAFAAIIGLFIFIGWLTVPKGIELKYDEPKKDKIKEESNEEIKGQSNNQGKKDKKVDSANIISTEIIKTNTIKTNTAEIINDSQVNISSSTKEETINLESFFQNILTGYIPTKISELEEGRAREDIIIRYYVHQKDGNKVYTLKKYKYYIHKRPVKQSKGMNSNVINYGDAVDKRDIQAVAYLLLKEGINLKAIRKTKYAWKSKAIEISTDISLNNSKNITLDDIKNFNK